MRSHKRLHSAGFAEVCQTRFEYNTGRKGRANEIGGNRVRKKTKGPRRSEGLLIRRFELNPVDVLLSHTRARAVPSGLRSLTAVFGMGTGGSSSLGSPRNWGLPKGLHWHSSQALWTEYGAAKR